MLPQAATKTAVPFGARVSSGDLCGIAAKAPTEAGAETGGIVSQTRCRKGLIDLARTVRYISRQIGGNYE